MLRRAEFYPGSPNYKQLTQGHEDGTHWVPAECDVSIRPGWFYHPDQDTKVKSLADLLEIYYGSVGRNGLLLLNVPADRRGLLHENDVARMAEFKAVLDETFKTNLAAGRKVQISWPGTGAGQLSTGMITDGNWRTSLPQFTDPGVLNIELNLGQEVEFDRIALQEDIRAGQRVRAFALEFWDGRAWKELIRGTTIGYKRLLRVPLIRTARLRLQILDSRAAPLLSEFGVYRASRRETAVPKASPPS
jgi:alpha-L-fucosidase